MFNKIKKPYFIAEISANHCGSISRAKILLSSQLNQELMQLNFKPIPPIQ